MNYEKENSIDTLSGARRRSRIAAAFAAVLWSMPQATLAADLRPEAVQQWNDYVKAVDARNREHVSAGPSFLLSDDAAGLAAKLRTGEIVVAPAGPHVPMKVASGLIHDWIGAAFIPNATLCDVLPLVRNYDRYKFFYEPNVIESKATTSTESKDQFSMVLINKSVVAKTAIDSDYEASYVRVDEHRWYSVTDTTRIQEIADYDTPSQHILPENHGTGLIWRLHSFTRFEERDGGVYIEVEAIALSRDVPLALRWMVDPIVRRVSRSALTTSLRQTESAVRTYGGAVSITSTDTTGDKNLPHAARTLR
jgi:hypothetical protein